MRLARTETNIAYRTADYDRQQDLDFVVGIEVHLSGNHTCKGVKGEFHDICDELQGRYPKDFKFTGWHPNCRCYTTTILKTPEEFKADEERIMRGEEPTEESRNQVADVPDNFKRWLEENEERIANARRLPYFLRDNGVRTNGEYELKTFNQPEPLPIVPVQPPIPQIPPFQVPDFSSMDWKNLKIFLKELQQSAKKSGYDDVVKSVKLAIDTESTFIAKTVLNDYYDMLVGYEYRLEKGIIAQQIRQNETAAASKIGVKQGEPMSFWAANEMKGNPHYVEGSASGYTINCQSSVVAYELRRRGFDVEAMLNTKQAGSAPYELSRNTTRIWIDPRTGKELGYPRIKSVTATTPTQMIRDIDKVTKEPGRYHLSMNWEAGDGHIITVERYESGHMMYYDPQNGRMFSKDDMKAWYLKCAKKGSKLDVYRVDDLEINTDMVGGIVAKAGTTKQDLTRYADKANGWNTTQAGPRVTREFRLERTELFNEETVHTQTRDLPCEGVMSKRLLRSTTVLDRFRSHCYNKDEVEAAKYIWEHPEKMRFIRDSPLGEGKSKDNPDDIKNIQKKKERGVTGYRIYEFDYNGKTYSLKTETHRKGFEQFYSMLK